MLGRDGRSNKIIRFNRCGSRLGLKLILREKITQAWRPKRPYEASFRAAPLSLPVQVIQRLKELREENFSLEKAMAHRG